MIAHRQAEFCLAMGMAPREFRRLSRLERQAFWDVHEQMTKRMSKRKR